MPKISDLIHIPEQVHQGDFVLKLTEGVSHAQETLDSYVVTPQLEKSFDRALRLIESAVQTNRSKAAYLHGSFGSGKSHFMAVLSLLLQGHTAARSVPELADVVSRHNPWTQGKRFLVVPYHLIGAVSLESAVLGQYAEYVRRLHPDAPTPGFYRAETLFDDARRLREKMGDDAFFANLGSQAKIADAGWGALDASWDAHTFEAAVEAGPGDEERARLVGDLVDTYFGAQRDLAGSQGEGFVPLDEGLVVLTRHAQALGYDAVILFLDELVLWLASHAADPAWVSREAPKVAKLVEAARMDRAVPLVSFIARQRDLRELVGEHLPGAQQLGFTDVLDFWEARFETITLEDRNLPAIVEKRLLRPLSPDAARQLDEAFRQTAAVREDVFDTLLTREGDREMFRQVYPFSPVLIQTLIAVSSLLQRERTALKLLVQLLVDQRDTLEVGDLVPVGDLYDVIESGDEPFSQAMKLRFDQARQLYRQKLIPLLEEQHRVTLDEVTSGQASEDTARAFRNDARLVKTLILSALAEGVEALKGLTPARLAALNHGTVRSPIPGQESQMVLAKIRSWAARVGEIKVADDARNPVVSVHLVGVDTEGVLENAKAFDNPGNRIQKVRQLLYELAGIPPEDGLLPPKHRVDWKGTRRSCEILFRNVRELPFDLFEPQDADWRIIIDYPFDAPGYGPSSDRAKIQDFLEQRPATRAIAWVPAFLTPKALNELGRLVVLDHVLAGTRLDEYGAHLSQLDRDEARVVLANQRDQVRQHVRNVLLAAYGVTTMNRDALDPALDPETYVHSLNPGLVLQPPVGAGFGEALENLFQQGLRHQFPAHPDFEGEVKTAGLRRVWEVVRRAAASSDRRVEVERTDRDDMRRIAVPLGLGQMGEAHFVLSDQWARDFEQMRAQEGLAEITVRQVRAWTDRPQPRGLPTEVQNLLVLTYALLTNRSFYLHGGLHEPSLDRLPDELELREQALPSESDWRLAVERAASILGVAASPVRTASTVARLVESVRKVVDEHRAGLSDYAEGLARQSRALGIDPAAAPRLRTAQAAHALATSVASARPDATVEALAHAEVDTSEAAMGTALKKAAVLAAALGRTPWELLQTGTELPAPYGEQAAALLAQAREALLQDEHVTALEPALADVGRSMLQLLQQAARAAQPPPTPPTVTDPPPPEPPPGIDPPLGGTTSSGHTLKVPTAKVDEALDKLREDAGRDPDAWVEVSWRITRD